MTQRLNYRRLIKHWMRFYGMTADGSQKMFAALWAQLQNSQKEKGDETNGNAMEHMDRKSKK